MASHNVCRLGICMVTIGVALPVNAHDSWLVTDRAFAAVDESVLVSFRTGDQFPHGSAPTQPDRVSSFVAARTGRVAGLEGWAADGNALGAYYAAATPGLTLLGCALRPRLITLEPAKFEAYLREERAESILADSASNAPRGDVAEQYTKFAKTIVAVEPVDPGDTTYSLPLGHRLEIIPLSNPLTWRAGQRGTVRVLLDGHPWRDVNISAGHANAGEHGYAHRDRTNAAGEVSIPFSTGGYWFIKAHFIRPAGPLDVHQWESYWATFSFSVDGPMPASATATPTSMKAAEPPAESKAAEPTADLTGDVRAIVAVHGELSPWAALGYRMGKRGMAELQLSAGDGRLLVIHRSPFELPYTVMADGIQASTHATMGRMTLGISKVDLPELRSEFMDQTGARGVAIRPGPRLVEELVGASSSNEREAAALRILRLKDDDLFMVTKLDIPAPPPEPNSGASSGPRSSVEEESTLELRDESPRRIGLSQALARACR